MKRVETPAWSREDWLSCCNAKTEPTRVSESLSFIGEPIGVLSSTKPSSSYIQCGARKSNERFDTLG